MGELGSLRSLCVVLVVCFLQACATPYETGARQSLASFDGASRATAIEALSSYNLTTDSAALRPGDLVKVKFTLAPELDTEQRVLPSGQIALPYIGLVAVHGKSISVLTDELIKAYAAHLNRPDLTVTVLDYARPLPAPRIYVVGAVQDAGAFEIDTPVTFLEALALAGGMDERAKRNALAVIRIEGDELIATIYQSKRILSGSSDQGVQTIGYLMPGDIVYVPQSGLSSAAEISRQVQQLIGFSGYSGSFGYRFRDDNDVNN